MEFLSSINGLGWAFIGINVIVFLGLAVLLLMGGWDDFKASSDKGAEKENHTLGTATLYTLMGACLLAACDIMLGAFHYMADEPLYIFTNKPKTPSTQ